MAGRRQCARGLGLVKAEGGEGVVVVSGAGVGVGEALVVDVGADEVGGVKAERVPSNELRTR